MRLAVRSLANSPGFTAVALVTLGLGIGVNTAMFSLIEALLFRSAPFPDSARLAQVNSLTPQGRYAPLSEPEFQELRAQATSYQGIFAFARDFSSFAEAGRPAERLNGILATAEIFKVLGVQPLHGRPFTAEETQPGRDQVVLLSHSFWQQRYGGKLDVIGRTVRIDAEPFTIIGVMPPAFEYRMLWGQSEFWRPLAFPPEYRNDRTRRIFTLIGRLHEGGSIKRAEAELAPLAAAQEKDNPGAYSGFRYQVRELHEAVMDEEGRKIGWLLLSLSGFVLLIACANLANLQLARATSSMRDFAIRAALGASRSRLIAHQLAESLTLSVAGGVLAVIFALWVNGLLERAVLLDGGPGLKLPINAAVLCATFIVAIMTGILFGIIPAWLASRTDVVSTLKSQSRGSSATRAHNRLRHALIVAEVTLAVALLGGAGIMQRGFARLLAIEPGWDKERILTGVLPLPAVRYNEPAQRITFYRKIEQRLAQLPGVERVALASTLPLWGYGNPRQFVTEGETPAAGKGSQASHVLVTSDFFATFGIPFVEGRNFAPDVKPDDPGVVIINEPLATRLWPGGSAIGRRIGLMNQGEVQWCEVIGVVRSAGPVAGLRKPEFPLQVYRPLLQETWPWTFFAIRSASPAALVESVRRAVTEVDPDLPADQVQSVSQFIDRSSHNLYVIGHLLSAFALLGVVLAAVGLFGVVSNVVAQRTGEFGIRLALGARPGEVLRLVVAHGVRLTLVGVALGVAAAYGVGRWLGTIMPLLMSPDLQTLTATSAILLVVATLACWLPARRVTRIDPISALRTE